MRPKHGAFPVGDGEGVATGVGESDSGVATGMEDAESCVVDRTAEVDCETIVTSVELSSGIDDWESVNEKDGVVRVVGVGTGVSVELSVDDSAAAGITGPPTRYAASKR